MTRDAKIKAYTTGGIIGFLLFTVVTLYGNIIIFRNMAAAHPLWWLAPLTETIAAGFILWSFFVAFRLIRTDPPMAILMGCIGLWMWLDRGILAVAFYMK